MSDQSESSQEKTHEATPQKLERARKKGDVARSLDMQTAAAYLGLTTTIFLACLLYTSPSPRDLSTSRMPSSA